MLKIRLMRIGGRQRPFYRVVAVDERAKRTGGYIELLGTYNPLTEPKDIKLKQDRIDHWIKQGAQLSDGFLRIIGKAPQRPARGPKKKQQERNKKAEDAAAKPTEAPVIEEATVAEQSTETPATKAVTPTEEPVEQPVIETPDPTEGVNPVEENPTQIATEPEVPRNDEKESKEKSERPA